MAFGFKSQEEPMKKTQKSTEFRNAMRKRIRIEWITQLDTGHFEYRECVLGMRKMISRCFYYAVIPLSLRAEYKRRVI